MKLKIKVKIIENKITPLLKDIIPFLTDFDVIWNVTYFEGVGKINSDYSLVELENKINSSNGGIYTTNEITNIFCKLDDLQEFEVFGVERKVNDTKFKIVLHDSSYWVIEIFDKNNEARIIDELKIKYC